MAVTIHMRKQECAKNATSCNLTALPMMSAQY
jgi:hypothetical protein